MSTNPIASKAPVTTITGRISGTDAYPRKNPTRFTTLVRLAADDEYTTPATVELLSDHVLGQEGDIVTALRCALGGRYRSYEVVDKNTGEARTVKTADNILTVL